MVTACDIQKNGAVLKVQIVTEVEPFTRVAAVTSVICCIDHFAKPSGGFLFTPCLSVIVKKKDSKTIPRIITRFYRGAVKISTWLRFGTFSLKIDSMTDANMASKRVQSENPHKELFLACMKYRNISCFMLRNIYIYFTFVSIVFVILLWLCLCLASMRSESCCALPVVTLQQQKST